MVVQKSRWIVVVLIVFALLLAVVLASLPPRLYVDCKPGDKDPSPELSPVDYQIIITGPDGAVDKVSEAAGVELISLRTCTVRYGRGLGTSTVKSLPFASSELRHLRMGLYELESGQEMKDALKDLNEAGRTQNVYAHPNYLVGLLGQSSCGSPWEVVGSPWEVVGSPWEVVGSPWEVVGSPWEVVGSPGGEPLPAEDAAEFFWNQWAFQQIGAGSFLTHTQESTLSTAAAADARVRIGVFDTSPFTITETIDSGSADAEATETATATTQPTGTETPDAVEWMSSTEQTGWWTSSNDKTDLDLTIYETELPVLGPADPAPPDLRDHGLFVAGLIHAVAPESDIHLYRVLDEHGCGQVFTISEAILHFAREVQADARSLDGAVINLSLGVHKPRTTVQDDDLSSAADDVEPDAEAPEDEGDTDGEPTATAPGDEGDTDGEPAADTPGEEGDIDGDSLSFLAEDEVASLRTAVAFATEQRIVIVAAAGNDSYLAGEKGLVFSPHYPAQYPSVIGVSASNALRQRSCFSNWGDVAAPGGDGGPVSELEEQNPELLKKYPELEGLDCVPLSSACSGDCSHALIGLVRAQGAEKYGYAYWRGTSFSTPLVSGAAALLLDASSSHSGRGQAWLSPDQVLAALRCGAPTPDGVINIPASLYRCLP